MPAFEISRMKKEIMVIKFLKALFGIYAIIVFILSHIIVIPCYLVIFNFMGKNRAPRVAHKVSRFWARLLFTFFFIRTDITGKDLIDSEKVYVFVSNHRSQLDIPLFALACRNTFRFLSKAEVARIPLLGYVVKNLYIIVDRQDKADRIKSMAVMKDSLMTEKISVVLYPEGTRNRSTEPLLEFKDGAFRLAIETQLPVAALAIYNSGYFTPPNKLQLQPGVLKADWCEPVATAGMTSEDVPRLKQEVRNRILEKLRLRSETADRN